MKRLLSFTLILSLIFPHILALKPAIAFQLETNDSEEILARRGGRRGGGRRGGGRGRSRPSSRGRGSGNRRSMNRNRLSSGGSGRVRRPSNNRRPTSNRPGNNRRPVSNRRGNRIQPVNRPGNNRRPVSNRPGNNRPGNNRRPVNNRPGNNRFGNNRRPGYNRPMNRVRPTPSRRINRNIINNGNIVVNPRVNYGGWGWNGGRRWYPSYSYWGGGFWGGFAVGAFTTAVTGAIINSSSSSDTTYVVIEKDSPGYSLFDSYGLTQIDCNSSGDIVFIYGPQDTLMCAYPNEYVVAGYYDVDPEDLTLVARD